MVSKLSFWLITDAPPTLEGIAIYLDRCRYDEKIVEHVKIYLQYQIVAEHLVSCENLKGTADIIIMDMSALTLSNELDKTYNLLKKFLRKHDASIFHLVSYCYDLAKTTIADIKEVCKEEDVVYTFGENGNEEIANYMFNKTLEYYPYE